MGTISLFQALLTGKADRIQLQTWRDEACYTEAVTLQDQLNDFDVPPYELP